MMINGGGGGGSGSDEDDVMTTMTATTNGSGGLWDGGGEGRPTMNVTNIAKLQFFFYFFQEDPNRFPDL